MDAVSTIHHPLRLISRLILLLVVLAALSSQAEAQNSKCTQIAHTVSSTAVYDKSPTFYSGSGWKLGKVITTLAPNTEVRICEKVRAGLFVGKKEWLGIEFNDGQRGWVFAGQVKIAAARGERPALALMPVAHGAAQETGLPADGVPDLGRWSLIATALAFVLLGMVGKVVYDEVDKSPKVSFRTCFRLGKCIKAMIAAPLSFGAFLQVGDFSFPSETAVVIFLCMAFQNGFFWQTLLPAGTVAAKAD